MYEYKILAASTPTASEEQLADMGRDGWMLQFIMPYQEKYYYYFMRSELAKENN